MNLFDAEIKNGQAVCDSFAVDLTAEEKELLSKYNGQTVTLGVRPENVAEGGNIKINVFSNENLGMNTLVNGTAGNHKITCKFRDWCTYKPGDTVNVSFNKRHFFDKNTTNAIR